MKLVFILRRYEESTMNLPYNCLIRLFFTTEYYIS